jgi:5-carboxymethyl-2-hydroxymuconate isomerase
LPHCIIEHSENFKERIDAIINSVHIGTFNSGLFDEEDIKTRAVSYENFQTGTSKKPFIHVTSKILYGRNNEQKSKLSNAILCQLKELKLVSCSLTVEVLNIDKGSYAKFNG